MKPEIEAKFLRVVPATIRDKLQRAGGTCHQPMRIMKRVVFDSPTIGSNAFVRVRDEGHRIAMTYKQFDEMSLTGAKEIEIEVSDYDAAIALLQAVGARVKTLQEARREIWHLKDVEVMIDEWPWIDPFIEIEGPSEAAVRAAAKELGFAWKNAVFGDVVAAYWADYPNTIPEEVYTLPAIRFDDPLPSIFKP